MPAAIRAAYSNNNITGNFRDMQVSKTFTIQGLI
jgi:hypothetical protein